MSDTNDTFDIGLTLPADLAEVEEAQKEALATPASADSQRNWPVGGDTACLDLAVKSKDTPLTGSGIPPATDTDFLGTLPQITDPDTVESLKVAEGMREITPAPAEGLPKLEELTYQVRHSPRCVKPFEVRLCGNGAGVIDGRIYQSRDFIGYGATFDEAAVEAMQLKFPAVSSQLDAPPVDSAGK